MISSLTVLERILEVGFVIGFFYPAGRVIFYRPFWNRTSAKTFSIVGLIVIGLISVAALAVFAPTALRIAAAIAILATIAYKIWIWRSLRRGKRPLPGKVRTLPRAPCFDRELHQRLARRHGPIFATGSTLPCPSLRPTVCVVGHEHGLELLRRHEDALQVWPKAPLSLLIPRGYLRYMSRDDHLVYSHSIRTALSPQFSDKFSALMVEEFRDALSKISIHSMARSAEGVKPRSYLDETLLTIFARVIFGIRPDTDVFGKLQSLLREIDTPRRRFGSRRKKQACLDRVMSIITEVSRENALIWRDDEDQLNCLLSEIARTDDKAIDDPTILGNLVFMMESGRNDVAGMLVWVLKHLGDNPDWFRKLQLSAATRQDASSLADRIVRETLRLEQSEYLHRKVIKDIEYGDYVIPRGSLLRICIREGHRSSDITAGPDVFNPDRFLDKSFSHVEYAPFGLFRHMCMGVPLVRTLACTFLLELSKGYDLEVTGDGPPQHARFHWAPHADFSIRLRPRATG